MSRQALDELKSRFRCWTIYKPMIGDLPEHSAVADSWDCVRRTRITSQDFLVDPLKNQFYCYGCNRGGDVIRFAELVPASPGPTLPVARLPPLLRETTEFYRMQLHRYSEAIDYLYQRGIRSPEVIQHMRIGYAPGGCLRRFMTQAGYPLPVLLEAGLVNAAGYDSFARRIAFPLEGNLYGRSISRSTPPHPFLPGAKGGLYLWEHTRRCPDVILVEGLFDYAALWQAGFRNVTCSLGTHLNARQLGQLCDIPRTRNTPSRCSAAPSPTALSATLSIA